MNKTFLKTNHISIRFLLAVLVLPLFLAALPVSPVSAALRSCRGDPKFYLSNGAKITSTITIQTDVANVSNVNYVLHAPKGLVLKSTVLTALGTGLKETTRVVFDQSAGKYLLDIVVTSRVSGVNVSATGQLNSGSIKTISGKNGQHLFIALP